MNTVHRSPSFTGAHDDSASSRTLLDGNAEFLRALLQKGTGPGAQARSCEVTTTPFCMLMNFESCPPISKMVSGCASSIVCAMNSAPVLCAVISSLMVSAPTSSPMSSRPEPVVRRHDLDPAAISASTSFRHRSTTSIDVRPSRVDSLSTLPSSSITATFVLTDPTSIPMYAATGPSSGPSSEVSRDRGAGRPCPSPADHRRGICRRTSGRTSRARRSRAPDLCSASLSASAARSLPPRVVPGTKSSSGVMRNSSRIAPTTPLIGRDTAHESRRFLQPAPLVTLLLKLRATASHNPFSISGG